LYQRVLIFFLYTQYVMRVKYARQKL